MTLVAFDFETLSQSDLSVLLGQEADVESEIRGLLEQGLRDEIDFATSLRQRVSLLEGMPADQVETAFERCQLRDGAAELIADLRRSDVSVAIITGSFERGVETALERADIAVDHLVANRLVLENGALTGEVDGPLLEDEKDRPLGESPSLRMSTSTERLPSAVGAPICRCSGLPGPLSDSSRNRSSSSTLMRS